MLIVRVLWFIVGAAWVALEIRLAKNSRQSSAVLVKEAKTEVKLWFVLTGSLAIAFVFKILQWLPMPIPYLPRQALAIVLVGAGVSLRVAAIRTLGGLFSTQVQIYDNHRLVNDGVYRHIRHPAYSGVLLAFIGIGIAFGDVLALLVLIVPSFCAIRSRITLEEQWLMSAFGEQYRNYCLNTPKLIPWVY